MKDLIGRFAISTAGHDKGKCYVIADADDRFCYLCDGKYHTLKKCKKKSLKHMSLCNMIVPTEIYERLVKKEKVFDHEMKYVIKMQEKGKEEGYVQK